MAKRRRCAAAALETAPAPGGLGSPEDCEPSLTSSRAHTVIVSPLSDEESDSGRAATPTLPRTSPDLTKPAVCTDASCASPDSGASPGENRPSPPASPPPTSPHPHGTRHQQHYHGDSSHGNTSQTFNFSTVPRQDMGVNRVGMSPPPLIPSSVVPSPHHPQDYQGPDTKHENVHQQNMQAQPKVHSTPFSVADILDPTKFGTAPGSTSPRQTTACSPPPLLSRPALPAPAVRLQHPSSSHHHHRHPLLSPALIRRLHPGLGPAAYHPDYPAHHQPDPRSRGREDRDESGSDGGDSQPSCGKYNLYYIYHSI